jgi:peptidyl-dipeptidase Dcp
VNPLLEPSQLPYGAIAFDKVEPSHFIPALKEAITGFKEKLEQYKSNDKESFDDTILFLEEAYNQINDIAHVFYTYHGAECLDEIQEIAAEISRMLTEVSNDVMLDHQVFKKVNSFYQNRNNHQLTPEQSMILEKTYREFEQSGALLNEQDKKTFPT